jgi:hypothetical protein
VRCRFHTGPKLGVTYYKRKKKNARPSRAVILYHPDVGKNQTLIKAVYQKVPSQK